MCFLLTRCFQHISNERKSFLHSLNSSHCVWKLIKQSVSFSSRLSYIKKIATIVEGRQGQKHGRKGHIFSILSLSHDFSVTLLHLYYQLILYNRFSPQDYNMAVTETKTALTHEKNCAHGLVILGQ